MVDSSEKTAIEELERTLGPAAFEDLVAGVRAEAEHAADLFCDALECSTEKPNGRSRKKSKPTPINLPLAIFVSALLRRGELEAHGFAPCLDKLPDLPQPRDSLQSDWSGDVSPECAKRYRMFAVDLLNCWISNFSWSARRTLGIDVVLGNPLALLEGFDELADYLHSQRHLASDKKGNRDVDS